MSGKFKLSKRSLKNLEGVHPKLVALVKRAIEITEQDFFVGEGVRSLQRQRELFARRATKTMNSRHLTGHAVDLHPWPFDGDVDGDGTPNGADWDQYKPIMLAMKQAAKEMNIALECGYDWGWDAPHYQLPWGSYPK